MSLRAKATKILTKISGLEEGELQKAFMLQIILFLVITTLLLLKPTVNSLFLSALSADALPVAFILTAIFAAAGSKFYDLSLEKFRLNSIILNTLIGTVILIVFFALAFHYKIESPVLMYTVYVFVAIYGLLVASQFWLVTNLVYNIRQAKRAFGFIGAGGIAGGILGGYLTSFLAHLMPSEYILFVAAFLVLCCVPLYKMFWKHELSISGVISLSRGEDSKVKSRTPFIIIKNSKLLTYITLVTGLSVLIAKLIDYQYSDFATRYLDDTEELSSFFGIWLSNISIISLLIQLYLTERILKTFSVGSTLLIMPAGILLGSVLLLVIPELWVVVFIKVVDGSFKQSVNKSAKELIFMPVPFEAKKKTKSFIDVVVDSVATGIAGIILFFFIRAFEVSSAYVSIIIIVMLVIEIQLILKLKTAYRESFRTLANPPAVRHSITVKTKTQAPLDNIPDTVVWIFKNGSTNQILHMLQKTFEYPNSLFIDPLKGLLEHESNEIRCMAIKNLYHLPFEDLSKTMEKLAYDPDPVTATQAMRYLLNRHTAGKQKLFENYFYDENPYVSNAALLAFAKELRDNRKLIQKFNFEKYIRYAVDQWQEEQNETVKQIRLIAILLSIGHARVKSYYKLLEEELTSPNHEVVHIALQAAGRTQDLRFLDLIVSHLSEKQNRQQAEFTLFKYGEIVINELKQRVFEGIKDFHDSIFIPEVIEQFKNETAIQALVELAEKGDHTVSLASIKSLIRLQQTTSLKVGNRFIVRNVKRECTKFRNIVSIINSLRRLNEQSDTALSGFLEEKEARAGLLQILTRWIDRPKLQFIYLLNLKYPIEDLEPMSQVLLEGKLDQQMNAAEFLENNFSFGIRRSLMPLIESLMVKTDDKYLEMFESLKGEKISEFESLEIILSLNNIKFRHAALYLISKIKDAKYQPMIKRLFDDSHSKIREHAKEVHTRLESEKLRS
ncbi:MAG: Npt1/Npt2 family nucleotide transporter [Flavobacteriaceae bacterium]